MISTAPLAPITAISSRGPGVVDVAAQVLGRHHVIGAAIGLARDDRDLGHRRFGISEQQFGAVLDDAAVFLCRAGQEARHVDKRQIGISNASQNRTNRAALRLAVDVQTPGQHHRLVGDDPDRRPSIRPIP